MFSERLANIWDNYINLSEMRKQENKSLGKRKKIYKEVNKALFLVEEKIYFKLDFY